MLVNRRAFLSGAGSMLLSHTVGAQTRDFAPEAAPERYPDPDVISLDKRFDRYRILYTRIQRLYTGMGWTEGPAWHGGGQYLVWSDIPNDRQYRWLGEDGHISVFRQPSHKGNGNTFDVEGRQISCEHETRRVVRYEHSGAVTVLAETWQGKPLNAPNDVVVHPDGGIWFTDPGYGHDYFMGAPGETYLKEAIYRIDAKSGKLALVSADMVKPNGLCFSPDYQRLYVTDTNARDPHIMVNDMVGGATLRNGRRFGELKLTADGKELSGFADGIRADTDGNVWAGMGWGGNGYDGVHVFAPDGQRIGQIRLPEICSNLCFGGLHRNRLFMTASQSLYSVYVNTQGAHFA